MTNEDTIAALRTQLAKQDEQLAEAVAELTLLGEGTTVPFPADLLRDLDEACQHAGTHDACQSLVNGLRA